MLALEMFGEIFDSRNNYISSKRGVGVESEAGWQGTNLFAVVCGSLKGSTGLFTQCLHNN